jgi:hypothetical protein
MTAPVVSVTVPTIVAAPVVCAEAADVSNANARTAMNLFIFKKPSRF